MKWKKDFLNFFIFIFKIIMYHEALVMLPRKILKMTHNIIERRCGSLKDSDCGTNYTTCTKDATLF